MGSGDAAWRLEAGDEWVARDPFGQIKPADISQQTSPLKCDAGRVALGAARNGYASLRLWVIGAGEYRLSGEVEGAIELDLFRAWYHRMTARAEEAEPRYCVDALVPMQMGERRRLPEPDNRIEGQTHQEIWVDLFVPAAAPIGIAKGQILLQVDGPEIELALEIDVLETIIPDEATIVCDHNSYGRGPFPAMYPEAFADCADEDARTEMTIEILHHYYRICREHRGLFSNLGAGHDGSCNRIYGPPLCGSGRSRSLGDWTWFDRHYGPVLDGSAFATPGPGMPRPRRAARPLWGVYTPITPDWPADYLWWGQPGYEVEFVRGMQQFDAHFREKGWVHTRPYFFFNHKKRYRWYEWDGDEPKYGEDDGYALEMGRLLKKGVDGSPVPWAYRMDASWRMKDHFERFAGMVDYWVCGGFSRWYPDEIRRVVERGEVVWTYSGTPGIGQTSAALLEHVLKTWARGISGHCEWLTIAPGPDPWFSCDGAETGMIYPGERFGLAGPIPSIRLKLQRNAVQDVDLISARAQADNSLNRVREELAATANVALWEAPPPVVRERPPEEWDSRNLSGGQDENMAEHAALDPLWWVPMRRAALGEEEVR